MQREKGRLIQTVAHYCTFSPFK